MTLSDAEFTDVLHEHLARIGRALGSPHRLVLLDLLAQGEKTVETLAERANYPIKNTSAHLRALREARLVGTRRDGRHVVYRLAAPEVARFLHQLRELGRQRLAEVAQLVAERTAHDADVPGIAPAALARQLAATGATGEGSDEASDEAWCVLDLRRDDEHAAGHVPGARSTPSTRLPDVIAALPARRPFVVYCRSAYCTHGRDAVALLAAHGRRAVRLDGGFAAWQAAGLPVEVALATTDPSPGGR
jgi:rhodanese-related sulfurtransferase/DNA-binding transcriptional ArsR family regulator